MAPAKRPTETTGDCDERTILDRQPHETVDARRIVVFVRTKRGWMWIDGDGNSSSWFPSKTEAARHFMRDFDTTKEMD